MSTPTNPAPSAAEVKERLKQLHRSLGSTSQDGYKKERETLTAAMSLIERGELERERMCSRVETGEFSDNCPFCLAKHNGPGLPNPMCHLCDLESERDNNRAELAAATERVKQLEDALNFIVSECDWEEGTATGDNRIGEACSKALAARAPKEGTP